MSEFDQVVPRYGADSLMDVLPSALAHLGVPGVSDILGLELAGVRRIAVLLVDGLGWHQIPTAAPFAPTLADLAARAPRMITTGFPSTTPTSLVSLGTGVSPGTHGVLGFRVAIPGTDTVLTHTHWRSDPDPADWQPVPTLFERAEATGLAVSVANRPEFAHSGLTVAANRGAAYRSASDVDELAEAMLKGLGDAGSPPALSYGYYPDLDRYGHVFGVDSEPWREAAAQVDRLLDRVLHGLPTDAALLVTADHGQLDVPAHHRFDFDADPRLQAGVRVVAGEPRVRYLHTLPGATDDVLATWTEVLGDAAWVARREDVIAQGWFGPVPDRNVERIGDVVAICHGTHAVVAPHSEHAIKAMLIAYHGAYSAVEMEIPLLVARP
ncbi:alkaline phosphatase family protein [Asanoa ishikariensis]|uniref:Type I phosphodiesterase / nucleotide pyrophosphatase n=1 Tax=Asanoa ishikariensis TaxID=137265 RepID=A0A1H3P6G5_9ACTN|nr:nucleotide pyrophosphatase/phosphodiesterase family protein [Asanoa ishikariensis]GIF68091.1 alkaline phosphatase family protein [Asanoa ishikariensis]SDY96395.1 Type I phosphodiesterase / nucleotide pyrophosphatase [Asanoa ishikariensis]